MIEVINEWVQNNFVQSIIIALMTTSATIFFMWLFRERKILCYEVLHQSMFLRAGQLNNGIIKILYNEEEVKNVQTLILRIINSGNAAIVPSDFQAPIELKFHNVDKILSYEIEKTLPTNLPLSIEKCSDDLIQIAPLLLNKKDYFEIKLIVSSGEFADFEILSRIKDVKKIGRSQSENYLRLLMFALSLPLYALLPLAINYFEGNDINEFLDTLKYFMIPSVVISLYAFIRYKFFPTQKR
jgi:hypothetical protein